MLEEEKLKQQQRKDDRQKAKGKKISGIDDLIEELYKALGGRYRRRAIARELVRPKHKRRILRDLDIH